MSRSYKKAIIKDKGFKDIYHKICRRVIKQHVKKFIKNDSDSIILPDEKEIVNDYDYSDYKIDYEYNIKSGYCWYNGKNSDNSKYKRK